MSLVQGDSVDTYDANVVTSDGTAGFASASPDSEAIAHFDYDEQVSVVGYCIGAPVHDPVARVTDERWLLTDEGAAIPYSAASARLPDDLPPESCPGSAADAGGPQRIALTVKARKRGRIKLRAHAPGASTVGFALFDGGSERWRPLALRRGNPPHFAAALPVGEMESSVALAVACWGPMAPATSEGSGDLLKDLAPFGPRQSRRIERKASLHAANGAVAACSRRAHGARGDEAEATDADSEPTAARDGASPPSSGVEAGDAGGEAPEGESPPPPAESQPPERAGGGNGGGGGGEVDRGGSGIIVTDDEHVGIAK